MTTPALDVAPSNTTEARQLDELLSESPRIVATVGPVVIIPAVDAEADYQRRLAEIVALDREHARFRRERAWEDAQGI